MKILWFTNIPLEPVLKHWGNDSVGGSGFWMHSLINPLTRCSDVNKLGVVYAGTGCEDEHFEVEGVHYYTVKQSAISEVYGVGRKREEQRCLDKFNLIIEEFKPDLIHIHGTERFYGQLKVRGLTTVPTVVSIQGLVGPYSKFAWGDKGIFDVLKFQGKWDALRAFPSLKIRRSLAKRGIVERKIIKGVDGVIGRTTWDKSYVWSLAPEQQYFHVDEMMRSDFSEVKWSINTCQRHCVYTTGRLSLLKGMHTFIEAMALLKFNFPDLEVRIAGELALSAENRYIQHKINKLGLSGNVKLLGWIDASQMVQELRHAHVYANGSHIENSPNSVCEAMLAGIPSVVPFTGGISSLIEHNRSGLMFPRGDSFVMANQIKQIFENNNLASSLGMNAKKVANLRHNPERILDDLIQCYKTVITK